MAGEGSCAMTELLHAYEQCEGLLMSTCDGLLATFKEAGLLYEMQIDPRQIVFYPDKRDGVGANYQEVADVMNRIHSSKQECEFSTSHTQN